MNKTLVLDIETFPMLACVWELKDQFIALNQIRRDWSVMAWGAKWLDEPVSKVIYASTENQKNIYDDKKILEDVWKLLDQADIVITQNGQSFDGPKLTARFMLHGMKPPSPYRHLDTYRIARKVADFTSNKLEYLTDNLNEKYKKLKHSKFPGMSLWNECEKRNEEAWKELRIYNIHDVLSTEELYNKIKAWTPESMPHVHNVDKEKTKCRICGSLDVTRNGYRFANHLKYARIMCRSCGAWSKGEAAK